MSTSESSNAKPVIYDPYTYVSENLNKDFII